MDEKKFGSRRKVLTGLTGGLVVVTQLPEKWAKPVVESVILPAHAQTSATTAEPTTAAPTTTPQPFEFSITCEVIIQECGTGPGDSDRLVDVIASVVSVPAGGEAGINVIANITIDGTPEATGLNATTDSNGMAEFLGQAAIIGDRGGLNVVAVVTLPDGTSNTCTATSRGC